MAKPRVKRKVAPGLELLSDGSYRVRVTWTDTRTGKRRELRRVVETYEEALGLRADPESLTSQKGEQMLFGDYAEQWLAAKVRRLRDTTLDQYTNRLSWAVAEFGDWRINKITAMDVRVMRDGWDCAPKTANNRITTLSSCLEQAVEDELIARNPSKIKGLRTSRQPQGRRGVSLSATEFATFLAAVRSTPKVTDNTRRLILTLAWTGCRIGEVCALRWEDYHDGFLHVNKTVRGGVVTGTKTDDPRIVPVPSVLAEALDEQRQWLLSTQHHGLGSGVVFPSHYRQHIYRSPASVNRVMVRICQCAHLPEISPHSLRRTYENLLRRAGVDQMTRRAMAGWRSGEIQAIYAGIDEGEMKAAVEAMVGLVGN